PAFDLLTFWAMLPTRYGPICDHLMWQAILRRGISRAHSREPTVGFRSQYAVHYRVLDELPPAGAKEGLVTQEPLRQFLHLPLAEKAPLLLGLDPGEHRRPPLAEGGANPGTTSVRLATRSRELAIEVPEDGPVRSLVAEIFAEECYAPVTGTAPPKGILD